MILLDILITYLFSSFLFFCFPCYYCALLHVWLLHGSNVQHEWPLPSQVGLWLGHLNIYHLLCKLPELPIILKHFHIFGFSSSRIFGFSSSRLSHNISDKGTSVKGFTVVRRDPSIKQETDIAVYFADSLNVYYHRQDLETSDIECIRLHIKLKNHRPIVVNYLCRNPSAASDRYDKLTDGYSTHWNEWYHYPWRFQCRCQQIKQNMGKQ